MNTTLLRSIGFWLLILLSLITGGFGAWLLFSQLTTMTTTLLDGTATGIEVYVGQSLSVLGSALLAAGVIGILIALALVAARSLLPASPNAHDAVVEPVEPVADTTSDDPAPAGIEETTPTDAERSPAIARS